MSPKTRRRVFLSVLMLALTLPAEVILLKALQAPDDKTAAQEWAESLTASDLSAAAADIQGYSLVYRKEILRALSPERRASVWRDYIGAYITAHKELDDAAIIALRAAQSALTPTALSDNPSSAEQAALDATAKPIEAALGVDEANTITRYLGARDQGRLAGAEPLTLRLASLVRHNFALLARQPGCDCASEYDCGSYIDCRGNASCEEDNEFPKCGYWWNETCDGLCTFQ